MTTRSKMANSEEVAAIEDLLGELEKRLQRLAGTARREVSGAGGDVSDFVSEALSGIMDRMRESAVNAGQSVGEQATRVGAKAVKTITDEVEERPLVMLAIAAGVGFLFGIANRR